VQINIDKIEGLPPADVANLRDKGGINDLDDLWSQVGADFEKGLKNISTKAEIKEDAVTALLIAETLDQLRIKHGWLSSFRNRYKWTYNGLRFLLLLIVVLALGYGLYRLSQRIPFPQQIVVTNPQGISAYRIITKDDIAVRKVLFTSDKSLDDPSQVVGRYALTKLNPSAPLLKDQMLPAELSNEINGKFIVSVPVKASALVPTPKGGDKLSLLAVAAPANNQPQMISAVDVILLAIEQRDGGPMLVVAVPDLQNVNAITGGSTIVGLGPPSKPTGKRVEQN
jgi:hypothetical protein